MRRSGSILVVVGSFAGAIAVAQIGGCTSNDQQPGGGSDAGNDSSPIGEAGPANNCSGDLPVMSIKEGDGTPDWSCYGDDASSVIRIWAPLVDAGDDAGDDGGDAATGDDGGDAATGTDGGADAATDSGSADAGGGDAATGGAYTLQVIEFVTHQPYDGAQLDITLSAGLTGNQEHQSATSADGGFATFSPLLPDGGLASVITFRATGPGLYPVNFYNTPIHPPPGATIGYTITSTDTQVLESSVLGSEPLAPNKTILVAAARDCAEHEVRGALIELVDDATGEVVANDPKTTGGARTFYFNDLGAPDPTCAFTSNGTQAVFSILSAPVNVDSSGATATITHPYSVRMKGRRTSADTQPVVMNQTPVELWVGTGNTARPYKQTPPK